MSTTSDHTTVAARPGWQRAFEDLPREHGFEALRVEGTLPDDLAGTSYSAGAGHFWPHLRAEGHWFDGDGAVTAVRFAGGRAEGAVRLVQSEGLLEERRAGKALHGGYDTPPPDWARALFGGFRRAYKNTAATAVLLWQGRLLAMMEGFPPTEVSPESLATLGETNLDRTVADAFSAHPHRVPSRRATYNFGIRRWSRAAVLDLYELPDRGPSRRIGQLRLPGHTMVHDFIVTDRYLVFLIAPLRLEIGKTLLQIGTYARNMAWKPELGTTVLLVPIDDPSRVLRVDAEPFFVWHFANAWDRGDDVVVDLVHYPDFASNDWLRGVLRGSVQGELGGTYQRAVISPSSGKLRLERIAYIACDFPQVSPARWTAPSRYAWVAAHRSPQAGRSGPFDQIARIDTDTGAVRVAALGDGQHPAEPIVVPRDGARDEDDVYVLSQVYDAARHASYIAVINGREPERVEARAWFDHHITMPFHGAWAPAQPV